MTQQDLITLSKLPKQKKNHRSLKIKNWVLKQTHDLKLAENHSPVT